MKLKAAPCLILACGMLISPAAAFGKVIPNPVANSGLHHPNPVANSHYHPMPVANSARVHNT